MTRIVMYFTEKFVLHIVDNLLCVSSVSSTETACTVFTTLRCRCHCTVSVSPRSYNSAANFAPDALAISRKTFVERGFDTNVEKFRATLTKISTKVFRVRNDKWKSDNSQLRHVRIKEKKNSFAMFQYNFKIQIFSLSQTLHEIGLRPMKSVHNSIYIHRVAQKVSHYQLNYHKIVLKRIKACQ